MKNETPNYYAIIPANVRYDNTLKANEKLMYGEITCLSQSSGKCFASNEYFAKLYGTKKETVSRWISNLSKKGYIKTQLIYKEGTNQIINRYIQINQEGIDKKVNSPIDKKVKDNNTSNNNTSNNKPIKQKEINNKLLDEYLLEDKDITSNGIEIVKRFIDYRKKIKAPIKTIAPIKAYIKALRVLVNSGFNIDEVIALQEEKEWRTINEEWVKKILLNENKKEKEWGN